MMRWLKRIFWLPFALVSVVWLLNAIDAFKVSLLTGNLLFAVFGVFALTVCAILLIIYLRKTHPKRAQD